MNNSNLTTDTQNNSEITKTYEKLEIRFSQLKNELFLVKKENEENSAKYIEILNQLSAKNDELEHLKQNLEKMVSDKTAELLKNTKELRERDKLLATSSEIATSLLGTLENVDSAASRSLRLIGEIFETDRVYIFENHGDPNNGELLMSARYGWEHTHQIGSRTIPVMQNISYKKRLPSFYRKLADGIPIYGFIKDFPEPEHSNMKSYGIKSILIIPITLRGVFWGLLGLENTDSNKSWNHSEISILMAIGSAIAGAIFRERTRRELDEARKKAEAATQAKSDFLANMSHEIRTPLNGVIGIIDLLAKTKLSEKQDEYLTDLIYSSDMLMSIINNVLDISKIEAGKIDFENRPFNLHKMLDGIYRVMKHKTTQKGVELQLETAGNLPLAVSGDMYRIRQVLLNLVSNAQKFTLEGFIKISAELIEKGQDKSTFLFKVTDTGTGIPADKIHHLFQKFAQADTSITRKFGGTGLGLAICKMLIEKMGGKIYVKSYVGEGSVFSFTLPLELAPDFQDENNDSLNLDWKRPPLALIAEDNPINSKISLATLQSMGLKADTAENGLAASNKFKLKNYDIVFMDINMPVMDGIEATKVIRRIEKKTGTVPIIALTAGAVSPGREKFIEAGMNGWITKPIEKDMLSDVLSKNLAHLLKKEETQTLQQTTANEIIKKEKQPELQKQFAVFDRVKALYLMNNSQKLLIELLEYFIQSTPEMIQEIEKEFADGKISDVRQNSHSLKGSGRNLALNDFGEAAYAIEKACDMNETHKIPELLKAFHEAFERCKAEVKNYLAETHTPEP